MNDKTVGDVLRDLANNPDVQAARAKYLILHEHLGVKHMDVDGYFIRDKNDTGMLKRISWYGREPEEIT